jgi:hypothetical protein
LLPQRGFNSPSGIPTNSTWPHGQKIFTREPPPKTKAELREMLAEAVRNTQAENKRPSKATRSEGGLTQELRLVRLVPLAPPKPVLTQPKDLTKSQLKAMLAEATANTARLLR